MSTVTEALYSLLRPSAIYLSFCGVPLVFHEQKLDEEPQARCQASIFPQFRGSSFMDRPLEDAVSHLWSSIIPWLQSLVSNDSRGTFYGFPTSLEDDNLLVFSSCTLKFPSPIISHVHHASVSMATLDVPRLSFLCPLPSCQTGAWCTVSYRFSFWRALPDQISDDQKQSVQVLLSKSPMFLNCFSRIIIPFPFLLVSSSVTGIRDSMPN
jgi:hypothetical protein